MRIGFELRGRTALLMHRDNIEGCDLLQAWRKDPKNKGVSVAGDDRSPPWTWQTYLYHDGESLAIPSENIMVCLRQAGAQMYVKGKKTFKEVSQAGMYVDAEFLQFTYGNDGRTIDMQAIAAIAPLTFEEQSNWVRDHGFRLFSKRATIGKSKHVRVRPRFELWSLQGEIEVIAPELTFSVLQQLFTIAGRVGIGDWRPGCKTPGPFGMFDAKIHKLSD